MVRLSTIVVVGVALVLGVWWYSGEDLLAVGCDKVDVKGMLTKGELDSLPLHCFFSGGYIKGREYFRDQVQAAGGALYTESLNRQDDLSLDFAVFQPPDKAAIRPNRGEDSMEEDRVLVHLSGTHGVEAHAGNAVQRAILEHLRLSPLVEGDPTVVLVHAVNPYGYRYHRRVNENNVDLNRNFLNDDAEWMEALQRDSNIAGYDDLNADLNPTVTEEMMTYPKPVNDLIFFSRTISQLFRYGFVAIKRAIVAGNYHRADGLGFGGFRTQPSVSIIRSFFERHGIQKTKSKLILIDVHTGLGPYGVDTLMANTELAGKVFTEEDQGGKYENLKGSGPNAAAAAGYDLTIGTTDDFCTRFFKPSDLLICVTQEFGTIPAIFVGKAQIEEMAAWRHYEKARHSGNTKAIETARNFFDIYSKQKLSAFYIDKPSWKKRIVRRGLRLFAEAMAALGSPQQPEWYAN
mmetsp:Transcript_13880/g.39493  ORF Transcript_13880/g.39493 Transcript_13880/m.39493 type:complete len:461 (+) Transcript_13880:90-1472(+)|eukprot:CAMPEP_0119129838 /NCGR_PEP_ID=MMETSP1310-20130426/7418_1 /TAXON_ID=464262 /ORGANISM="Genus nov. species nov., Strain RCC2339" /LENGTH=460 /DNA_ID=CAMNT_0007120293 /DNA_START=79 /DNA_END=1461 /DNA_ORIENTATION=-